MMFIFGGSPYQIGTQIGEALKSRIDEYISIIKSNKKTIPHAGISEILKLIKNLYPEIYDELFGMARGSNNPISDILLLDEESVFNIYEKCTTFSFNGIYGHGLAHNEDWDNGYDKFLYVAKIIPNNKASFITISYVGLPGGSATVNDYGVAFSSNAMFIQPPMVGIPKSVLLRHLCDSISIDEFLNKIQNCESSVSSHYMAVDFVGNMISVEKHAKNHNVYFRGQNLNFVHTNHAVLPGTKEIFEQFCDDQNRIQNSRNRLELVKSKLHYQCTTRDVKQILKNHDKQDPICRHDEVQTIASAIIYPAERLVLCCIGNPCKNKFEELSL